MTSYVFELQAVDATDSMLVGNKSAHLGELAKIEGLCVPDGFCITTHAFRRIIDELPALHPMLDRLALLTTADQPTIAALSAELRALIEAVALPPDLHEQIRHALAKHGPTQAYAVRSSATAEDLPTASFAGQQDTYLNIIGAPAILTHIIKCWASLFSERAIIYRLQNGFDHRSVELSVLVQTMVVAQASGIVFTADPLTGSRKVVSINAGFGLGEALVSGLVNSDTYTVTGGERIEKKIATKQLATYARASGGTIERELAPEQQKRQVLTDDQIIQLERLSRTIEAHFGWPQDIEWCLADDVVYIVQSRPITTLFPIPAADTPGKHVFISVGHQQMMTDPIKPLGISVWQLTAGRPMYTAGGRLFVDVIDDLADPAKRHTLINVLGTSDPLIKDALTTLLAREDGFNTVPGDAVSPDGRPTPGPTFARVQPLLDDDPTIVTELIEQSQAALSLLQHTIQTQSGTQLFDFIRANIQQLRLSVSDARSFGVIMTAMNAWSWLNAHMLEWLGEKNAADMLSQSVSNNITSEMGLALLDVADAIRPYPAVVAYLQQVQDEHFLEHLPAFEGGQVAQSAINAYLTKYGMRCAGEIDITRPRWSEKPTTLIPLLLSHIKNVEPGASQRKFEQGRQAAWQQEQSLLERLKLLPDGEHKAVATKRMIDLMRNVIGYREYPKYHIVNGYFMYKQALMKEAEALVQAKVLHEQEDVYYLTFEEFHELVRTHMLDQQLITTRKAAYAGYAKLRPPRIITSDGEIVTGAYQRAHLPPSAIVGLPVSAGVVEGRARVILRMEDADLQAGDILVTPFTDPSWTPLFVSIKGLVTEVGGLMTHGAVIAREYGLPAVVGVEQATTLIQDGQWIRVHGTDGYIELLSGGS